MSMLKVKAPVFHREHCLEERTLEGVIRLKEVVRLDPRSTNCIGIRRDKVTGMGTT